MRRHHPLYHTHWNMLQRCYNEDADSYPNYGGRGIYVCDRWTDAEHGFSNFLADMGQRPDGCTMDRVDNDGPYSPDNCRWADANTQQRNTRQTKLSVEAVSHVKRRLRLGHKQIDIASAFGVSQQLISRIRCGLNGTTIQEAA